MAPPLRRFLLGLLLSLCAVSSCGGATTTDPVAEGRIATLGPEEFGVARGEFHRAGQPCVVCHSPQGPAKRSPFTIAGTVFVAPGVRRGLANVEVEMTDVYGTRQRARTNCVGNFFVRPHEWKPQFPVTVHMAKDGVRREMKSLIGREPDCAACHALAPEPSSQTGHVFLLSADELAASEQDKECPVDPWLD